MGRFIRDDRGGRDNRGGGRSFSGRGGSSFGHGNRDDRPREMFKAVCSNCGKECEVPFKPTTGKPVYCSDCFEKVGGRPERSDRPRRDDRPQSPKVDYSVQFEMVNQKLDKLISLMTPKIEEVVEKPTKIVKAKKIKASKKAVTE